MSDRDLALVRLKIVHHLRHEWRFSEGGSSWRSFDALADEIGEPVDVVRREVRKLARAGAVYFSPLFRTDGGLSGSGYILTNSWERSIVNRKDDPEWRVFYIGDGLAYPDSRKKVTP